MENNTSANIVRDILQLFKKESLDTTAKNYIAKLLLIFSRLSRYVYWSYKCAVVHTILFRIMDYHNHCVDSYDKKSSAAPLPSPKKVQVSGTTTVILLAI